MREDLFATTIVVQYHPTAFENHSGWSATVRWRGGNYCEPGFVEGDISTRYFEKTLSGAIDMVLEIKNQFGLKEDISGIALFYKGDDENEYFPPPSNYKELLKAEANKRNWKTYSGLV